MYIVMLRKNLKLTLSIKEKDTKKTVEKNGQSRDTDNVGHINQNEGKHNKAHKQQIYSDVQVEPHHQIHTDLIL